MADKGKTQIDVEASDKSSTVLDAIVSKFKSATGEIEGSWVGGLSRIGNAWTAFAGALGVGLVFDKILDARREWEDTTYRMAAVFGINADKMMEKAEELSAKTGKLFSTNQIANTFAKASDYLADFGLTGSQQLDLLSKAAEIAAIRGMDLNEVMTKLTGAMAGQARAGRAIGVATSDAYMKYVAFGGALEKTWDSMSEGEKWQKRFIELMRQTEKDVGAAAEKTNTLTGAIESYKNKFTELMIEYTKKRPGSNPFDWSPDNPFGTSKPAEASQAEQRAMATTLLDFSVKTGNTMAQAKALAAGFNDPFGRKDKWLPDIEAKGNRLLSERQKIQGDINKLAEWYNSLLEQRNALDERDTDYNRNFVQTGVGAQGGPVGFSIVGGITDEEYQNTRAMQDAESMMTQLQQRMKEVGNEAATLEGDKLTKLIARTKELAAAGGGPEYQRNMEKLLSLQDQYGTEAQDGARQLELFRIQMKYSGQDSSVAAEQEGEMSKRLQDVAGYSQQAAQGIESISNAYKLGEKSTLKRLSEEAQDATKTLLELRNYAEEHDIKIDTSEAQLSLQQLTQTLMDLARKMDDVTTATQRARTVIKGFGAGEFQIPDWTSGMIPLTFTPQWVESPAVPFQVGYDRLVQRLESIPQTADFYVKAYGSQGGTVYDELTKLQQLQAQYNQIYAEMNDPFLASRGAQMMDPGYAPMMKDYYSKALSGLAAQIQAQQIRYQSAAYSGAQSVSNIASGASGGSSVPQINLNFTTYIEFSGSGDTRDDVITLGDRLDDVLADKIDHDRSKILAAIKGAMKL